LNPGNTRWIPLVFQASGLAPGEYQGVVRVRSARTGTEIRVPYWYGIASNKPKRVTILNQPDPGTTQSTTRTFFLLFRMTDDAGIPSAIDPKVTISGTGSVGDVYSIDEDIADSYVAELTLARGDNTVRIEAGDASQEIVITGR